jgi:hypothetical protein
MGDNLFTHRIDVRRTKRGSIIRSYPIAEKDIESWEKKYNGYIVTIRKPRKQNEKDKANV